MIRDADGRIACIRHVLPQHKAATWVWPGRARNSTQPGANGVFELSPFEFLDRLADLIPQPRKHRHRYHGVFADIAVLAGGLAEPMHGDPADRLIVATTSILGVPLVTGDKKLQAYRGVKTIW